jgi:hypothetical protein
MTVVQRSRLAGWFATIWLFTTVLLLAPAAWNGAPLLYPDSMGYFRAGEATLNIVGRTLSHSLETPSAASTGAVVRLDTKGDGIQTSRSIYYGVPLVALYDISGGTWAVVLFQSALVAAFVAAALRRFLPERPRLQFLGALAIATIGGLGFYSSLLLPDVFLGVALVSLAALLAFHREMKVGELSFWLLGVLAAALVHKGHLFVMVLTVGGMGLALLLLRQVATRLIGVLVMTLALAFVAHSVIDLTVKRVTGAAPVSPPFVLARMIGDGTAEKYLAAHCGTADFQTCRYVSRMPMSENQFLWSHDRRLGAFGQATPAEREKIIAEAPGIVIGTLKEHLPLQVVVTSWNVIRQFFCVGVNELGNVRGLAPDMAISFRDALTAYPTTAVGQRTMPLGAISWMMLVTYLLGLMGLVATTVAFAARRRTVWAPAKVGIGALLLGLIFNAVLSGAVSGVFDRYQGRVAWLVVFAVLVALAGQSPATREPTP